MRTTGYYSTTSPTVPWPRHHVVPQLERLLEHRLKRSLRPRSASLDILRDHHDPDLLFGGLTPKPGDYRRFKSRITETFDRFMRRDPAHYYDVDPDDESSSSSPYFGVVTIA